MIKEALEFLLDLRRPSTVAVDGLNYMTFASSGLQLIKAPLPDPLTIHTLTGLIDYFKAATFLDDLQGEKPFFHVISHKQVNLCSEIFNLMEQRKVFMEAELPEGRGFPFSSWLDPESFIIAIQAQFVQDNNTAAMLAFVNSIKEVNERVSSDDGTSQTVTTKSGAVLVSESKVPNPVSLRPYRTFLEVEQPAISCVFRLQQGPRLALFEADGGLWRLEAIQSIKNFLKEELAAMTPPQEIPVIA